MLEFRRLLRSPLTWLIMGLTILSPVMGLFLYQPAETTTLGTYLANPSLAAGIFSSLLFAFLTIWEWDRIKPRADGTALVFDHLSADCFLHPPAIPYWDGSLNVGYNYGNMDALYHDDFRKRF